MDILTKGNAAPAAVNHRMIMLVEINDQWPRQLEPRHSLRALVARRAATCESLLSCGLLAGGDRACKRLTAVRDPAEMVRRQLLDSLSILPWVTRPVDPRCRYGAAGLPGIPLAIARPDLNFSLLDTNDEDPLRATGGRRTGSRQYRGDQEPGRRPCQRNGTVTDHFAGIRHAGGHATTQPSACSRWLLAGDERADPSAEVGDRRQ